MTYDFDAAILGGGPGGYEAAIRCAQYGLKTALIEARELGGTCLNRGCIPTKALLHGAEVFQTVQKAGIFGVETNTPQIDFAKLAAYKDAQVKKLRRGVEGLEKGHGVTVMKGFGILHDAHTISIDEKRITAQKLILAMGSAPAKVPIPGIDGENVLTSDDVLSMTKLPQSLVIIGGGVIGIEFATLFSALGCSVTVLEMMPDILPGVDPEITALLKRGLKQNHVTVLNSAKVLSIAPNASVTYELNGVTHTVDAEKCVVCVGRRPMTAGIGLEAAGVELDRGFVRVDAHMQTSVPGIYAIGDITGKMQLAHVASAQGMAAAANCAGKSVEMRYNAVPACIYTNPEIAYIGLNEKDAKAQGREVRTGTFSVAGNGRSMIMGESTGLAKLVTDANTGEILGAQIMAPRATDLISEIAVAMGCEGTIEEVAAAIHPHPTVSEIIMEAAHDVEGLCCHKMPR